MCIYLNNQPLGSFKANFFCAICILYAVVKFDDKKKISVCIAMVQSNWNSINYHSIASVISCRKILLISKAQKNNVNQFKLLRTQNSSMETDREKMN